MGCLGCSLKPTELFMSAQKLGSDAWREKAILLIEDNGDDAKLTSLALQKIQPGLAVEIVQNGQLAINYLKRELSHANRILHPLPDLILLDLYMPGTSGFQVLQWVRSEPAMSKTAVVVISGSERAEDAKKAYQGGADAYLIKPTNLGLWLLMLEAVLLGWFRFGQIPKSLKYPPPSAPDPNKTRSSLQHGIDGRTDALS